jgi:hypothetical protein
MLFGKNISSHHDGIFVLVRSAIKRGQQNQTTLSPHVQT